MTAAKAFTTHLHAHTLMDNGAKARVFRGVHDIVVTASAGRFRPLQSIAYRPIFPVAALAGSTTPCFAVVC